MRPTWTVDTRERETFLPYCLPLIGEEEIAEVVDSLRSGWVTTGPKVNRFERDFADYVGSRHAIALNSCTAALHISLAAIGVGPGDEVIVPTLTFCATANVVVHLGAKPVIVDVDENGHIAIPEIERAITPRTKAIIPVHYAGQACDLKQIMDLAADRGLSVIEDAAHAAGAEYGGRKIGSYGLATCFSFYAIKNMTTGEGGMITTNDDALAARMRLLALHGMSRDAWKRYQEAGSWFYEVVDAGYKQNMTDIQAALGIHQLRKLGAFIQRRQQLASMYDAAFAEHQELRIPSVLPGRNHTYHLYPIQIDSDQSRLSRAKFIDELKDRKVGTSVHFIPLHRHPFYSGRYGYEVEQFPVAEMIYRGLVSLPLYPRMTDEDAQDVVRAVKTVISLNRLSG